MFGGAELPALWGIIFLAALADSALRYVSLAKLEEDLDGREAKDRFATYLEAARPVAGVCVLVRSLVAAALTAVIVLRAEREWGGVLPAVAAAGALLALAELGARIIGRTWAPQVVRVLLPPLHWLAWPLRKLQRRAEDGGDDEPEPAVVEAAKEEIRVAIQDGTAEGALEAEEREMIEGILKFGEADVGEIMTPRTDMECLEAHLPLQEAVRALAEFRHSRIPVYEGNLDTIVGIAYVKDLLTAVADPSPEHKTLRDVVREPLFVPETKTVSALLEQFQREHVQIAIVLDEYGGVAGLLSVEDILEEIVGEIQDEYDQEDHESRLVRHPSGAVEVDARMRIDEVNDLLGLDIPADEDYDTVGGFVTAVLARVPAPGDELEQDGVRLRVLESDRRRVRRVLIERPC